MASLCKDKTMEEADEGGVAQPLFLGIDCSTQSLKAVVIREVDLIPITEVTVHFDTDLPQFGSSGGAIRDKENQLRVTAPTLMWVAALDLLLAKMKEVEVPFKDIAAVSGSGQQHGSVYWQKGASEVLANLQHSKTLCAQLEEAQAFSVSQSPIWMDSSTAAECTQLEEALGGPQKLAKVTGSRAFERFTGNQIAKISKTNQAAYQNTERISLVSSFLASLFIGSYAPIDRSDGSGMNLMDINNKVWWDEALKATAPDLELKLGTEIVPSHSIVGSIAPYFVQRYGFNPQCLVMAFSGDNPNSVAGMRLAEGDISISLGTSDTVFGVFSEATPSPEEGHVFCSPTIPEGYMGLICYKNGSLTREDIRNNFSEGSWETFNKHLQATEIGNNMKIGFYFKEAEITPKAMGYYRFAVHNTSTDKMDFDRLESFSPEEEVRAIVEGQFLSMRLHAANIGMKKFSSILATGGGSSNEHLTQVMANVFGVPVYKASTANSASLGAAYRAYHGWLCHTQESFIPFKDAVAKAAPFNQVNDPDMKAYEEYSSILPVYAALERSVVGKDFK